MNVFKYLKFEIELGGSKITRFFHHKDKCLLTFSTSGGINISYYYNMQCGKFIELHRDIVNEAKYIYVKGFYPQFDGLNKTNYSGELVY